MEGDGIVAKVKHSFFKLGARVCVYEGGSSFLPLIGDGRLQQASRSGVPRLMAGCWEFCLGCQRITAGRIMCGRVLAWFVLLKC